MTGKPPVPEAAVLRRIGHLLDKHYPPSRKRLKLFIQGKAGWDGALRAVRGAVRAALADVANGPKIPLRVRTELNDFAGQWGTETRSTASIEERNVRKNLRFGFQEWEDIESAAGALGITPTDFVRNAAVTAAREGKGP